MFSPESGPSRYGLHISSFAEADLCGRWRSNPFVGGRHRIHPENARKSGRTVTSTMHSAARPSGRASCGDGAGYSAMMFQSLCLHLLQLTTQLPTSAPCSCTTRSLTVVTTCWCRQPFLFNRFSLEQGVDEAAGKRVHFVARHTRHRPVPKRPVPSRNTLKPPGATLTP